MNRLRCSLLLVLLLSCLIGCSKSSDLANGTAGQGPGSDSMHLIATTGQINSALVKLTKGTNVTIQLFCGPGVDPHSFSPSTSDVQAMADADLIIFNGFHLEAKLAKHLDEAFQDKSWSMASAFPTESRIDWMEDGAVDPDAPYDPHIWNHLPGWSKSVEALGRHLATVDPGNEEVYQRNVSQYVDEISEAHAWALEKLSELPKDRRVIVSAHDAFNYFAQNYNMETLAVLGIGNDPEADIKTMRDVATKICDKKIPAIFMESITNPKVIQALKEACDARDWQVEVVPQTLYSDDLGESAPVDTFLGAFRSNVKVIFESLSGQSIQAGG